MKRFTQFLRTLGNHGSRVCIVSEGSDYTYSKLLSEMALWHERLEALDLKRGVVIGLRADYSLDAVAALIALFSRNAIVALIPRDRDCARYLDDAQASGLLELETGAAYRWHPRNPSSPHPLLDRLREQAEAGIVLYTSGTTGRPKAALQSVERFLYKFQRPGRGLRTLALMLLDHVAGLDTLFYALVNGGTLIVTRDRRPSAIMQLIESQKVEVLPASPSFLRLLCAASRDAPYDLSSLKVITYGAELMDPSTLAKLNGRFPGTQIIQKYGTTETGSPRTVSRGNDSLWLRIKSDEVETKVVNGVLWLRSEGASLGYLNAPSPFDNEGWYCTGDLVRSDGEWIQFQGRVKDLINVGGEKVTAAEIEQVILELDFVRDAAVSGEPHAMMGEIVSARVSLSAAAIEPREAARQIRWHCRQRLASYKVPVKIVIVPKELVNERHKIRRAP